MERKMFGHRLKKRSSSSGREGQAIRENVKDAPPGYEGKEHVKYLDPGYSSHEIDFPEDEPHMKSHVSRDEEHEMEDNYHMDVPKQTDYKLPDKIPRARMKMDAPDQQDPKPLRGNMVHNVPYEGELDTTGTEEMGPHDMQKEGRKKLIVAVMKRKMGKKDNYNESLDEDLEQEGSKHQAYEKKRRRNDHNADMGR